MTVQTSDFPHPIPSFRVPVVAPGTEPTDAPLVSVCFNYSWLPYVLGALDQLLLQSTWADFNAPPDLATMHQADRLKQQFAKAYDDASCETPLDTDAPTPFWDEDQDVEDSAPAETQEWYGEVADPEADPAEITFLDNLAIWAFTGFIAYSGQIGAAIFFHSIAPRFVLAFRRGDVGEVIRVIIDGAEYDRVDTSAAAEGEVIRLPVLTDPELEEHDIYLIKAS